MASSVGRIWLDLSLNSSGFNRQLGNINKIAQSASNKISSSFKKIGIAVAAAFSVKKIIDFSKSCVDLGSDLQEVQNVVDVTFSSMTSKVDNWAKSAADTFGLSETMAKKYTGLYGSMAKAFGFSEKEVYNMSTALAGLAGDTASFYNITQDEAYTKLKSVFSGETETLKDLGIVMTQTALDSYALANGYGKITSEMTEAEKVSLRYAFVTDQLSNAQGDFVRTQDNWANQSRVLKLRFDSLKATLGKSFIAVLSPLIHSFNSLLEKINGCAEAFNNFVSSTFGIDLGDSAGNAGAALAEATVNADSLTDSIDTASDSAKKLKGNLAGFDNLNVISTSSKETESSNAGANVGGMNTAVKVDTSDLDKTNSKLNKIKKTLGTIQNIFNKGFLKGFNNALFEPLKININEIGYTLKEIFTDKEVVKAAKKCVKSLVYNLGRVTGSAAAIATEWATAFTKGAKQSLKKNANKIKKALVDALGTWSNIFDDMGDVAEALRDILTDSEVLNAVTNAVQSWYDALIAQALMFLSVGTTIAYNIVKGIKKYINQHTEKLKKWLVNMLDISARRDEILANFYDTIADIFTIFRDPEATQITADIIGIFSSAFMGVTETINNFVTDFVDLFVTPITDNAKKIKRTVKGIFKPLETVLSTLKTAIDDTFEHFKTVYDEKVKPAVDKVKNVLSSIVGTILDEWNNNIKPVLDEFAEKFKSVWKEKIQPAIDGISDAFGKLASKIGQFWEFVKPIVQWVIKKVMPIIAAVARGIGTTLINALGALLKIVSSVYNFGADLVGILVDIVTLDFSGLSQGLSNLWSDVVGVFSGAVDLIKAPFQGLASYFSSIWATIKNTFAPVGEWFSNIFSSAWNGICSAFSTVGDFFSKVWTKIRGVFAPVVKFFKTIFSNAWKMIKNAFKLAGFFFGKIWNKIKAPFKKVGHWFSEKFSSAWNGIKNIFAPVGAWFGRRWADIKKVFANVGSWFSKIFTSAWEGVKKAFSNVGTFFSGIWSKIKSVFTKVGTTVGNAVSSAFKTAINAVLKTVEKIINTPINAINSLIGIINKVPGIELDKLSTFKLPRLAKGGLVKAPTLAVVGDNAGASSGNPEVVAPLNKLQGMMNKSSNSTDTAILSEILKYLKKIYELFIVFKNSGGNCYEFIAKLNGSVLFDEIVKREKMYRKRHNGKSPFA